MVDVAGTLERQCVAQKCLFTASELRLIYATLHPDYILPAARSHGMGDAPLGAYAAFHEARALIRTVVKNVVRRTRADMPADEVQAIALKQKLREDMRFVSWIMELGREVQPITPLLDPRGYRNLMIRAHPATTPWQIQGLTPEIRLPESTSPEHLRLATLRAVGKLLLDNPHINRAVLPALSAHPRVYARSTPHVYVPVEFDQDDLSAVVVDPEEPNLRRHLRRQFRKHLKVRKHWLHWLGQQLLAEWLAHGYIASWGGAFVSDTSRYAHGWGLPIFVAGLGCPISIVINPIHKGVTRFGVAVDHRAMDGKQGQIIHAYLSNLVPSEVEELSHAGS